MSGFIPHLRKSGAGLDRSWGRFTALGGPAIERTAATAAARVRDVVRQAVSPSEYRALVLIGGYGRGEGGVLSTPQGERLHNNMDLLLILRGRHARLKEHTMARLRAGMDDVEKAFEIGVDFTTQSESHLRRAPCLVMWYDMRCGHKTLAGDPDMVPGMSHFRRAAILPSDVRNLLVNRAALLLLNDFILDCHDGSELQRRAMVKHVAKAIVGYGDAVLFFSGLYHWSYLEKRRRMRGLSTVSAQFRRLYDQASAFRLAPDYEALHVRNPRSWMQDLERAMEPVHLSCERARLGLPDLDWHDYGRVALRHALLEAPFEPRRTARKLRHLLSPAPTAGSSLHGRSGGLIDRTASRAADMRELAAVALPAVLYPRARAAAATQAGEILGARSREPRELRRAFLRTWRTAADPNLDLALERLGIEADQLLGDRAVTPSAPRASGLFPTPTTQGVE